MRTRGPWSGRHDTCFAQLKFPPPPPAPRGTMLKGNEWIRSCKINAHICFECPAHRLSTLYKGGRGVGRRKLGTLKKKTSPTNQGSVSPQDRTSVYFARTGISLKHHKKDNSGEVEVISAAPPKRDEFGTPKLSPWSITKKVTVGGSKLSPWCT